MEQMKDDLKESDLTASTGKRTDRSLDSSDVAMHGPIDFHFRGKRILHLFSGPSNRVDGFANAVRALGGQCVEYDLVNGAEQDLANDHIWQGIMSDIKNGVYDALLAGPPCNTFTNARRWDDAGPKPLRGPSGDERYGYSFLGPSDKEKVKLGTLLAVRTTEASTEFHEQRKPFIVEQPRWKQDGTSVSMYNLDEFQQLLELVGVECIELDQCEFGAPTTKPTTLIAYLVNPPMLQSSCNHSKQLWIKPSTGEKVWSPHPPLQGKEWYIQGAQWNRSMLLTPQQIREKFKNMPYLTSAAQAYPADLNNKLAHALISAADSVADATAVDTGYELVGRWRNVLKRRTAGLDPRPSSTVCSKVELTTPLRGKRKQYDPDQAENECWGGTRNPKKISNSLPNYRVVGAQIYSILDKLMDSLDGLEDRCLSSIGSEDCNCGPTAEQDDAVRRALHCIQDDAPMPNEKALDTKIEANLLWKIGRAMGDPDTDIIHQWLCSGAPAGISLPIADPGCIFPADIESHGEGETIDIPDHHGHTNYSSVDDDAAAEPEVNRLIETGLVKEFSSYEDLQLYRGPATFVSLGDDHQGEGWQDETQAHPRLQGEQSQ